MSVEWIHIAASMTVILGFVAGVFSYVILRPLNKAISDLNKAINDLRMDLLTAEDRRHELEIKVAEIDQRARAAHHRIDRLEGRQDDLEHR
jgi:predicted  nucleic acid-binding Zn-ribbon protein